MLRLSKEETGFTLARYGAAYPQILADHLDQAGYVLVAVSGPALTRAIERGDLETLPPADPEVAQRIEQWCDPSRVS
jgi:hypothetical protein